VNQVLEFVRGLHGFNALLIVLAWVWAFGLLLGLIRPVRFSPRGALRALTGTLYLQVLLGLLMFGLMAWLQTPAFHGHSGLKHMGGGGVAAVFATLALWQNRSPARPWMSTLWCALTLVTIGLVA